MIVNQFVTPEVARRQLAVLDGACFPHDTSPEWDEAEWLIVHEDSRIAAYCAWRQEHNAGFHYRAGVDPAFRGRGLQRNMLTMREYLMRRAGLERAITYTDADNAASMRNLIAESYLPYDPSSGRRLSGPPERLGRVGFVHWEKKL